LKPLKNYSSALYGGGAMSDLDRGIMKFKGADSAKAVVISSVLVLGGIGFLLWWALQSAYVVN
jgi:hypothetical protein